MTNWRTSRDYRIWRVQVIRRDKVCKICGSNQRRQAHHINSASYFVDERFDIENGVTLCYKCHMNFHCNYKKSYREKCTIDDYENFVVLTDYFKTAFVSETPSCEIE